MSDEILAIDPERYRTNADILLAAAEMGYLAGRVLDATYGTGAFWKRYRPDQLVTNDTNPVLGADHQFDFRALPDDWGASFDSSVFDPAYKQDGTPGTGGPAEANALYGVAAGDRDYESVDAIFQLYSDGLSEMHRVTRPGGYELVKCMDQVAGMKTRWQSRHVANYMESLGDRHVTTFFLVGSRKQPAGRIQRNPRNNYSQLMVFTKGKT